MAIAVEPSYESEVRRCQVTIPTASTLSKQPFRTELVLNQLCLSFSKNDGTPIEILLEDLVGVTVLHEPPDGSRDQRTCRLIVNAYPTVNLTRQGKNRRLMKAFLIDFDEEESFEKNHRVALEWKEAVLVECDRAVRKTFVTAEECRGAFSALKECFSFLMSFLIQVCT